MSFSHKIRETFQSMGYTPGTFINQQAFYSLLNQLGGGQFDIEVARELWDQASMKSDRDVRIEQLADVIVDAHQILNNKIRQTARDINQLNMQRGRLLHASMNQQEKQNEIRRLDYQLEEARKDLIEYQDDLRSVTIPFQGMGNVSRYSQNSSYHPQNNRLTNHSVGHIGNPMINNSQYPTSNHPNVPIIPLNNQSHFNNSYHDQHHDNFDNNSLVSTAQVNQDLKIVLWIAIAMGILQIIIMYKKFDFLNLLIIVTLLSIFLLDYFDSTYIKVCVGLVVFSIVLDIVWLCMYASTFWSPPLFSEHNQGEVVYLRFIVLFTLIILVIKMPLVVLLLKYRDIASNTNFVIPVYGKTQLNVVSNRGNNLISQGCGHLPLI